MKLKKIMAAATDRLRGSQDVQSEPADAPGCLRGPTALSSARSSSSSMRDSVRVDLDRAVPLPHLRVRLEMQSLASGADFSLLLSPPPPSSSPAPCGRLGVLLPVVRVEQLQRQRAAEAGGEQVVEDLRQRGDAVAGIDAVGVVDRLARRRRPG